MSVWDSVLLLNTDEADSSNDITKEVGNMATIIQVKGEDRPTVIGAIYDAMKREFAELIDSALPDIYGRNSFNQWPYNRWLLFIGYSYLQTDEVRELIRPLAIAGVIDSYTPAQIDAAIGEDKVITIPTLTTTAAALFIKRALIRTQTNMRASMNSGIKPFETDILYWTEEAKRRWKDAQKRIFIDFSKTGQVLDPERGRVRNRSFSRG